jgi:TonB dependent receptor-like, beta-barrel
MARAMRHSIRLSLLLGSVVSAPVWQLCAQRPAAPAAQASAAEPDEDVVVTGKGLRGSVVGDIPPQNILHSRDVKATGATSFDELLDAIAPQIGAARQGNGANPLVLLNGRRVSSYRELRDIPIEAISRVDILPEEVALKYGYPPDEKVVNVVLQKHFVSTIAQASANKASQQGFAGGSANGTHILLDNDSRTTINLHVGSDDILSGAQRSLAQQQYDTRGTGAVGLLLPSEFKLRGTATVSRDLPHNVEATGNIEADFDEGHGLSGLSQELPAELNRDTTSETLHVGGTLSGDTSKWHWNLAGNANVDHSKTRTDDAGVFFAPGSATSTRALASVDGTLNGELFALPAGAVDMTLRAAASADHLDIDQSPNFVTPPRGSTSRSTGSAGLSLDVPIAHRGRALGALGNLTINGNAQVDELSDFGTLTRIGAGANWSPAARLNLLASLNREEQAPSIRQLGDPFVQTPGTRIFDFTTGVVPRVAVVTGGDPDLRTERRNILDISGSWQPFDVIEFKLRADYARVSIDRPISDLTVSPILEAAFPERFVRGPAGNLLSVDLRPVNFDRARRDTLQVGFDFTKPLRSRHASASEIDRILAGARAAGIDVPQAAASSNNASGAGAPAAGYNGRLTFSLTDSLTLDDRAVVRSDLAELDYLHGAAIGQTGGQPRHQVQAQAGWSNHGVGARIGANWRSATDVETITGDMLHFSPVATFDLRLFANVGQDLAIVAKHPWLAGSSIRFEVGNIFNTQPKVRNAAGDIPIGYAPEMLDPLGRTVMISIRKQFLPASYYREQLQRFQQRQLP